MAKLFAATAMLLGTIIGAGYLALPYVTAKAGIPLSIPLLALVGALILHATLTLGEISLRTPGNHQLAGYASLYLSNFEAKVMFLAYFIGILTALIAYITGVSHSLAYLLSSPSASMPLGILFWTCISLLLLSGRKALEKSEAFGVSLVVLIILLIAFLSLKQIQPSYVSYFSSTQALAPLGVMLFAYIGFSAVSEAKNILSKEKHRLRYSILLAYLICFVLYALFSFSVAGAFGPNTPEIASVALGAPFIILSIITISTSSLSLSTSLFNSLNLDEAQGKKRSWFIVFILPLALFIPLEILRLPVFIAAISISGIVSGGLVSLLILRMAKAAKQKGTRTPEYQVPYSRVLNFIFILLFLMGAYISIKSIFQL